jgi:hypothetical protein
LKLRGIGLSIARRLVVEHCRLCMGVPAHALVGTIDVGRLVAARAQAAQRPAWTAIFAKAQALAALEVPELRRIYVKLPWPHICEVDSSVAAVVVEREVEGEQALLYALIKSPETTPLLASSEHIRSVKSAPLSGFRNIQVALRVARLPQPLRRLFVWLGRNMGRQAASQLGTFGISAIYGDGFFFPNPATHWTSFIIYTPIGADGSTSLNFVFDHRVMDGSHAIAGFRALQAALLGPVLAELQALAAH